MRNMNDCSLAAALGRYDPQYSPHSRTMADDRSELQPATAGEIACTAHTTQHWYIYNIQTLHQWLLLAVILICMLFILCMIVLYSQKLFYCLPKKKKKTENASLRLCASNYRQCIQYAYTNALHSYSYTNNTFTLNEWPCRARWLWNKSYIYRTSHVSLVATSYYTLYNYDKRTYIHALYAYMHEHTAV